MIFGLKGNIASQDEMNEKPRLVDLFVNIINQEI